MLYGVHKEMRLSVFLFLRSDSGVPAQVSESLGDQKYINALKSSDKLNCMFLLLYKSLSFSGLFVLYFITVNLFKVCIIECDAYLP